MPVLPAPNSISAVTDIWPTMARYSAFSPESEIPFSGSPSYSNGNITINRTMSEQSTVDSLKDRHARLMSSENEKNKFIEVGLQLVASFGLQLTAGTITGPPVSARIY